VIIVIQLIKNQFFEVDQFIIVIGQKMMSDKVVKDSIKDSHDISITALPTFSLKPMKSVCLLFQWKV
jgi:hypothetical protein